MKVSEWTGVEWKKRKPLLLLKFENDPRLKPWNYCTISRSQNGSIIIRAPAMCLEWYDNGEFYIWFSAQSTDAARKTTQKISIETILYAQKVLREWAAEQDKCEAPKYSIGTRGSKVSGSGAKKRRKAGQR